ncbi:MAG: radical SAM protein [Candidatus Peribacteraceae bacterium]|nr:radical SAM protein [Candidatus Peribacteraceae bacterium]
MKVLEKIESEVDNVVKYVFDSNGSPFEVSYINKNQRTDDEAKSASKHIICVSTHSGCIMGCKFCHLTGNSTGMAQITPSTIVDAVEVIYDEQIKDKEIKEILVSFMGSGEPLMSSLVVTHTMSILNKHFKEKNMRFALATMLPNTRDGRMALFDIAEVVKNHEYNLKVHLSLHFTDDELREHWMPNATNIETAISALEYYANLTGNEVEIHYALIDEVNDSDDNCKKLAKLLKGRNIPIKFLKFNPSNESEFNPSDKSRFIVFRDYLSLHGIQSEYYEPNGADVGASCGQFKLEHYK